MDNKELNGRVEPAPLDSRWPLALGAGLALALGGCAYSPDRTELEAKVAAAEEGRFGSCIDESYRAGVELQLARDRLKSLQEGSPSDTELAEGIAAAERAQELRAAAEQTCLDEKAGLAEAQRVRELEGQLAALNERLIELETTQTTMKEEILVGVNFETDSAALTPEARAVLDIQAGRLVRRGAPVLVAGYTSATGSQEHNLELSARRAEAVRAYLIERGVDPALISARGFGMADPIASNETPGGRRRNQRIELQFQ